MPALPRRGASRAAGASGGRRRRRRCVGNRGRVGRVRNVDWMPYWLGCRRVQGSGPGWLRPAEGRVGLPIRFAYPPTTTPCAGTAVRNISDHCAALRQAGMHAEMANARVALIRHRGDAAGHRRREVSASGNRRTMLPNRCRRQQANSTTCPWPSSGLSSPIAQLAKARSRGPVIGGLSMSPLRERHGTNGATGPGAHRRRALPGRAAWMPPVTDADRGRQDVGAVAGRRSQRRRVGGSPVGS